MKVSVKGVFYIPTPACSWRNNSCCYYCCPLKPNIIFKHSVVSSSVWKSHGLHITSRLTLPVSSQMLLRSKLKFAVQLQSHYQPDSHCCDHCTLHPGKSAHWVMRTADGHELPCCRLSASQSPVSSTWVRFTNWYMLKYCNRIQIFYFAPLFIFIINSVV